MKNKPQQKNLGLDTYNSDEEDSGSSNNTNSEDYKPKKKGTSNKRNQEEIKNKIIALTKKRKQDVGSSVQSNSVISKTDENLDSFRTYIYLPCKFMDNSKALIDMLLRDVLYRDPYNFLLFSPCTITDPFFVGHHVSLSKSFNVKKSLASQFRNNLEQLINESITLPIKVGFKSISMYLGSSSLMTSSDTTPSYAIYLAFDLSDEHEERITSLISNPFCTPKTKIDTVLEKPLIEKENLWFSRMHVSFACRLFKDRESQVDYYKECLRNFTKIKDDTDYPTSFKVCSINTAAQHLVGSNLTQSKENRLNVTDARREILSSTLIDSIGIEMGVKSFNITIPAVSEPPIIKETWQITVSIGTRPDSDE